MREKRIQNAGPSEHFAFQNALPCVEEKLSLVACPLRYTKNLTPVLYIGMPSRQLQQLEGVCDQCWPVSGWNCIPGLDSV